jgi:Protein of unknown function (DUF3176)
MATSLPLTAADDEILESMPLGPLLRPRSVAKGRKAGECTQLLNFHRERSLKHSRKPVWHWLVRMWNQPWIIETISCLLSCVAFAAIILTLALHAGQPMPQWPNLISINSLIAIFTAIMKAALLLPVTEGVIISHMAVEAEVPRPTCVSC